MPIPAGTGKYNDIEKFDRTVFKMNRLFALSSDIMNRKILEPSFEAIVDAGIFRMPEYTQATQKSTPQSVTKF